MRKISGKFLLLLSHLIFFRKARQRFRTWVFVSVIKAADRSRNKPEAEIDCYFVVVSSDTDDHSADEAGRRANKESKVNDSV